VRDSFDGLDSKAELAFLGSEEAERWLVMMTFRIVVDGETYLRIMMLNLLIFFRSMGSASFFSFPR
jgi:hypothetical protein